MGGRDLGLRGTVALTCAALVFGVSLVLTILTSVRSRDRLESEIGSSLAEAAVQMSDKLDRSLWSNAAEVEMLAKLGLSPRLGDPVALRRQLDSFKAIFPVVSWMGVVDLNGRVMAATDGVLDGADVSERPVFRNGREQRFVGDVHEAVMLARLLPNPSGEAMKFVDISTPVRDARGDIVAVLATHLSWDWTREIRQSLLNPMNQRQELDLILVAKDRTVLLGPPGMIGHPLEAESVRKAAAGGAGWTVELWPGGRRFLVGYAFGRGHRDYQGLGWTVLARQPLDIAFAPVTDQTVETALAGGVMVLVFSVMGWFAAGWLTRPLRRITEAAERIRSGDHAAEMPVTGGSSEITSLSATLRELVDWLTHRDAALVRLGDIAYQDRLTGLPNRRSFDEIMERVATDGTPVTILYIDLDGFKPVNDRLGHDVGDAVLRQTASRLASCFRGNDVVARLGGDEFAAVLPSGHDSEPPIIDDLAARAIAAVNEPMVLKGEVVTVGCSIGIAHFPTDADELAETLRRADQALYQAKREGRNRAIRWSRELESAVGAA